MPMSMLETQGEPCYTSTPPHPTRTMERTLDFNEVTDYGFSLMGADMVLSLFQGDVVTKIHIETTKNKPLAKSKIIEKHVDAEPVVKVRARKATQTKLTEDQVKDIRANWEQTVKACGTKTAAAEKLGQIYNCSPKNIYAIIYKYSWAHI
jgi:hypothetical protein